MSDHYYVDGYNVIYKCPELRPLALKDFEAARDTFVDLVAQFCSVAHVRATVVFDGRGSDAAYAPPLRTAPGLEIVYSPGGKSADAFIERAVYQTRKRLDVVVVSADRGIRDLCGGLGALVMDSEHFLTTIHDAINQARHGLQLRHAHHDTMSRLGARLDEGAAQHLLDLRARLKED